MNEEFEEEQTKAVIHDLGIVLMFLTAAAIPWVIAEIASIPAMQEVNKIMNWAIFGQGSIAVVLFGLIIYAALQLGKKG